MADASELKRIVEEINTEEEKTRRALSLRRYEIYRDGGKRFLLEQLRREFKDDAIKEMRLAPLNVLKKVINKKSSLYRRGPLRRADLDSDQALIDYYAEQWNLDVVMQRANRYYSLDSNLVLYLIPQAGEPMNLKVCPAYLYSVKVNANDPVLADAFIFNRFEESGEVAPNKHQAGAASSGSFSRDTAQVDRKNNRVASGEIEISNNSREYIYWSDEAHYTLDENGAVMVLNPEGGDEQFINPVGLVPVVSIQKENDIEYWARQGEDLVELALTLQLGWSDLLTIAKHQGFSIMTIASEEEPKKQEIGINKAVWLKIKEGSPTPSVDFVQASSPIGEYKAMLMDLMALMLSTNDMNAKELVGSMNGSSINSAAQALVEMADTIEAREEDKATFRDAEKELWMRAAAWHNWLYDVDQLPEEAKALGKFSDEFSVSIHFSDVKPVESEQERIATVEKLLSMGLITRPEAMKKLYPDLTDEQIEQMLADIEAESMRRAQAFGLPTSQPQNEDEGDDDEEEEEEMSVEAQG